MVDPSKIFYVGALIFLLLGLFFNLYPNLPRVPGDIDINKAGFKIYIPITSAIIISVTLTLILNFFRK